MADKKETELDPIDEAINSPNFVKISEFINDSKVQNKHIQEEFSKTFKAQYKQDQEKWSKILGDIIRTNNSFIVGESTKSTNSAEVKKQIDEESDEIQFDKANDNIADAEKILQLFNEGDFLAIENMGQIPAELLLQSFIALKASNQINQASLEIIEAPSVKLTSEPAEKDTHKNNESDIELSVNRNEFNFSGLLNTLKKNDGWFYVIDDMTLEFYNTNHKIPNETQAWGALCTNPPEGYIITIDKHRGEDSLNIHGANRLSRSAFTKRWKNYTANNTQ